MNSHLMFEGHAPLPRILVCLLPKGRVQGSRCKGKTSQKPLAYQQNNTGGIYDQKLSFSFSTEIRCYQKRIMIEMRKKSSKLSTVFAFSGTKQSKSIIVHNFLIFMLVKITFLYKQLKNCRSVREFQNSREVSTRENTRLTDRECTKCLEFS